MAFWNKEKKEIVKKLNRENTFKIIQFAKMKGLRKKEEVEYTTPISPIFGTKNIKNVDIVKNTLNEDVDTDFKYDSFREENEKKLTKEEIIERKGSELYDFETVDKKLEIEKEKEKENKEISAYDMFGEDLSNSNFNTKNSSSNEDDIFKNYLDNQKDDFLDNLDDLDKNFSFNNHFENEQKILDKEEEFEEKVINKPIGFNNFEQNYEDINQSDENKELVYNKEDYNLSNNENLEDDFEDLYKNQNISNINNKDDLLSNLLEEKQMINNFNQTEYEEEQNIKEEEKQDDYEPLVFSTKGYENGFSEKKSRYFLGSFEKEENEIQKQEEKPENIINNNFSFSKNTEPEKEITVKYETLVVNKTSDKEQPYKQDNEYNPDDDFVIKQYYVSTQGLKKNTITLNDKPEWLLKQVSRINETLELFKIDGKVVNTKKGPTVTRYEIDVDAGVKVNKVASLQDNFQMQLAVTSIRIEAPIPGKRLIGIEAPNEKTEIVKYANVIDYDGFYDVNKKLEVPLGLDIDGNIVKADIKKMPHGLIAGATNSGKSVCVNTILISLILKNSPEDLRLILVDPKKVELMPYNDIPHLITPVIDDPKIASQALKWAVDEMEKRYELFSQTRVRNIEAFNEKVASGEIQANKMHYLIIIIDELADLMQVASQDVEISIQRITQKARAAGIHLLIATQRPTTDVVKGTIKANIPTRIAFKVASYTDSSTILDGAGAEKLLGKGDMLFKELDQAKRLQGALIKDEEIYSIIDDLKQRYEPNYLFMNETLVQIQRNKEMVNDDLFKDVARFVVEEDKASINQITKTFKIGFNRAQELVRNLEAFGILEIQEGNKPSKVVVTKTELEELLSEL